MLASANTQHTYYLDTIQSAFFIDIKKGGAKVHVAVAIHKEECTPDNMAFNIQSIVTLN